MKIGQFPQTLQLYHEITKMTGRPSKDRRKKVGETKKLGKFPRTILAMTCNLCHVRGHKKRGCPQSAPLAEPSVPSVATSTGLGRGKPKVIFTLEFIT